MQLTVSTRSQSHINTSKLLCNWHDLEILLSTPTSVVHSQLHMTEIHGPIELRNITGITLRWGKDIGMSSINLRLLRTGVTVSLAATNWLWRGNVAEIQ